MGRPKKGESGENIIPECPKVIPRIKPENRIFNTAEECQRAVDTYFDFCDQKGIPYTITGLCISMGTNRMTWKRWIEGRPDLKPVLEEAKTQVEHQVEVRLLVQKNVAGPIFNLVNNFKWRDVKVVQDEGLTNDLVNRLMEAKEKKRKLLEGFNQSPDNYGNTERSESDSSGSSVIN